MTQARERAHAFGIRAELMAALWLRLKFYKIIACNFSAPGGEIDIVARRGSVVAFVEVKARPLLEAAQESIGAVKIARISRAARFWLARNPSAAKCVLRGDAVFIAPGRAPLHVCDAFTLDIFR